MAKWRTARRIAALTMVGTAYKAYAGVCNLAACSHQLPKTHHQFTHASFK